MGCGSDLLVELLYDRSMGVQQHAARALGTAAYNDNVKSSLERLALIEASASFCVADDATRPVPEVRCIRDAKWLQHPNKRKILMQCEGIALTSVLVNQPRSKGIQPGEVLVNSPILPQRRI